MDWRRLVRATGARYSVRDGRKRAAAGDPRLHAEREAALRERQRLDRFLAASDPAAVRLSADLEAMPMPLGTDWRWRPPVFSAPLEARVLVGAASGTALGEGTTLFHDCPLRATILSQVPSPSAHDLAPCALKLEVMGFSGQFLSLSVPLPPRAVEGLTRQHIIRLQTSISIERGIEIFARLNLRNGPNIDQRQVHLGWLKQGTANRHVSEFDLAETEMDEDRLEAAWIDLILDHPRMNAVLLRDMVVSRHPRADI